MLNLWLKALHLVFMVAWFAGLFYLPRLFVYHAQTTDAPGIDRFKLMERKLYYGIMTPAGALTIGFGLSLWLGYGPWGGWLYVKLALVLLLVTYHLYCGKLMRDFEHDRNRHGHVWYRWFNDLPVLILLGVVLLAVLKPF